MMLYEIKKSVCNRKMLLSVALGFLCLVVGGSELMFAYHEGVDFSYMFLFAYSCGTASFLSLLYPVFACLPYADIYGVERNSGYLLYQRVKIKKPTYIASKLAACSISGGVALSVPVALYFLICIFLCGTKLMDGKWQYISHNTDFYAQNPVLYCAGYIGNAFICGAIFALLGLTVSLFLKNSYLIIFLPLVISIFLNILFSNIFLNLNPSLWWDINLISSSSQAGVNFLKASVLALLSIVFSVGVIKSEDM